MTRKLYPLTMALAILFVLISTAYPAPAQAQADQWIYVTIEPESGHWNYPNYFRLTASQDVVLSWEIKCTQGGCFGRQPEIVTDQPLAAGESILVGWGPQCYRWQFDPVGRAGFIAEPDPVVCASLTATATSTATEVTETATPTETTETLTPTPATETLTPTPATETVTPTVTGTIITTPPTTPDTETATPTVTGTVVTTPPATPGTDTPTPVPTDPPSQPAQETPRSQLIAVTGADRGDPNGFLPRLLVSLGIVVLGLGMARLGITRKLKR